MPYPGYWSGDYYWSGGEYCRRHECRVLGHWRCRCVFLAVWEMPTTDSAADCGDGTYRTGASISTVLPYCFPEPEQIPGEAEAALTRLHKALWPRRKLERAMRFELTTPTLARLCSTPELRPLGAGPVKPVWPGDPATAPGGPETDQPAGCRLQARTIPSQDSDASVSFNNFAMGPRPWPAAGGRAADPVQSPDRTGVYRAARCARAGKPLRPGGPSCIRCASRRLRACGLWVPIV